MPSRLACSRGLTGFAKDSEAQASSRKIVYSRQERIVFGSKGACSRGYRVFEKNVSDSAIELRNAERVPATLD
jgi:hypothetical protein